MRHRGRISTRTPRIWDRIWDPPRTPPGPLRVHAVRAGDLVAGDLVATVRRSGPEVR
jgi:hypothetical protein